MELLNLVLASIAVLGLFNSIVIIIMLRFLCNKAKTHQKNHQADYAQNYQVNSNANIPFNANVNQTNNNQANNGVKFCTNCGTQTPVNQNFCGNCGAALSVNAQQTQNYHQ